MAPRLLVENAYFRLSAEDAIGVARLVRTATPFPSGDSLRLAALEVERAASSLPPRSGLLIDARDAPARNDAEFEAQFVRARRPILALFARVAVLVRSAVGKLQVARYGREDGVARQLVFDDEVAALEFLAKR
jgi:hypothetical protein